MDDQALYLRPPKLDMLGGCVCAAFAIWNLKSLGNWSGDFFQFLFTFAPVVGAWWFFRTRKYVYKNFLGLQYLNTLHGMRWKWGEGNERIKHHIKSLTGIDPRGTDEKVGEKINLQDIESFAISNFIEKLQQGIERIETSSLSQQQRSNLVLDFQVLGTEFQRQAEKIKRVAEDAALATRYQHIALYCQKEAKRLEASAVGVLNEVSAQPAEQGEVEELSNIGGSVRLLRHEGRVIGLRFYGLPRGEYTVIVGRQMKTLQIADGTDLPLSEMGTAPQAHGAFMINSPDGANDAVRW